MLQNIFEYPFLVRIFNLLLNNEDKMNLIICNKYINNNKHKLLFFDNIHCYPYHRTKWYYNRLINITVFEIFEFPKLITNLKFDGFIKNFNKNCIPNSVIHLTFGTYVEDMQGCIPDSITHLTFSGFQFKITKTCIPNSSPNLVFGDFFIGNIDNCIPNSITYLRFGKRFCDFSSECLPNSIRYLIFDHYPNGEGWSNSFLYLEKFLLENKDFLKSIPIKYIKINKIFKEIIEDIFPNTKIEYF